jgi:hypothetical protein
MSDRVDNTDAELAKQMQHADLSDAAPSSYPTRYTLKTPTPRSAAIARGQQALNTHGDATTNTASGEDTRQPQQAATEDPQFDVFKIDLKIAPKYFSMTDADMHGTTPGTQWSTKAVNDYGRELIKCKEPDG